MLIPKNTSIIVRRVPTILPQRLHVLKNDTNRNPAENVRIQQSLQKTSEMNDFHLAHRYSEDLASQQESVNHTSNTERYASVIVGSSETAFELNRVGYPSQAVTKSYLGLPPPSYICHRCSQPGHYIQNCPTNGDSEFDVPRMKLPVGIPKSRLKVVPSGNALQVGTVAKLGGLLLPGGQIATLQANDDEFHKATQGIAKRVAVREATIPEEYRCLVCREILKNAVLLPCCAISTCDNCANDAIQRYGGCPLCNESISTDRVLPNKNLRVHVESYLLKKIDGKTSSHSSHTAHWNAEHSSNIAAVDTSQLLARANLLPKTTNKSVSLTRSREDDVFSTRALYEEKTKLFGNIPLSRDSFHAVQAFIGDAL